MDKSSPERKVIDIRTHDEYESSECENCRSYVPMQGKMSCIHQIQWFAARYGDDPPCHSRYDVLSRDKRLLAVHAIVDVREQNAWTRVMWEIFGWAYSMWATEHSHHACDDKEWFTMGTNAERIRKYKAQMETSGFKRLSAYIHPDLVKLLERERLPHECTGRTLERLLLGESRRRPGY